MFEISIPTKHFKTSNSFDKKLFKLPSYVKHRETRENSLKVV